MHSIVVDLSSSCLANRLPIYRRRTQTLIYIILFFYAKMSYLVLLYMCFSIRIIFFLFLGHGVGLFFEEGALRYWKFRYQCYELVRFIQFLSFIWSSIQCLFVMKQDVNNHKKTCRKMQTSVNAFFIKAMYVYWNANNLCLGSVPLSTQASRRLKSMII